ncbi:hypothetical protein GCM10009647_088210 [Streptomyces sanglieri]
MIETIDGTEHAPGDSDRYSLPFGINLRCGTRCKLELLDKPITKLCGERGWFLSKIARECLFKLLDEMCAGRFENYSSFVLLEHE